MLKKIPHADAEVRTEKLNFLKKISTSAHHHHEHGHEH